MVLSHLTEFLPTLGMLHDQLMLVWHYLSTPADLFSLVAGWWALLPSLATLKQSGLTALQYVLDPKQAWQQWQHLLTYFVAPQFLWGIPVGLLAVLSLRRFRQPRLGHSHLALHANLKRSSLLGVLGIVLACLFPVMLSISLARPFEPLMEQHRNIQVHRIVIAVDKSGSMNQCLPSKDTPAEFPDDLRGSAPSYSDESKRCIRRIDAATWAVMQFVKQRHGDQIELLTFDDQTYKVLRFWYDANIVLKRATTIRRRADQGTNFQGPCGFTDRLGPIQAAITDFHNEGDIHSEIFIMVTDGDDSIADVCKNQYAEQLISAGIHSYALGVGQSWQGSGGDKLDLRKLIDMANGKVFRVADPGAMQAAFSEINRLEPDIVDIVETRKQRELGPYFALSAIGLAGALFVVLLITRERP